MYHVYKFEHEAWQLHRENRWYNDWRMLGVALGVSCVGIIVRSMHWPSKQTADDVSL